MSEGPHAAVTSETVSIARQSHRSAILARQSIALIDAVSDIGWVDRHQPLSFRKISRQSVLQALSTQKSTAESTPLSGSA